LTNFDLNARAGGLCGGLEQNRDNIFINVFFAAIAADSSGNSLENQGGSFLSRVTVAVPSFVSPFLQITHFMISFSA
jgi:hypothetical protein